MVITFKSSLFPVVLFALAGARGHGEYPATMEVFRLPTVTRPVSYELRFIIDFDENHSTFSGQARITILATCTVRVITLNAKDLDVSEASVMDLVLEKYLPVHQVFQREHDEQLEIRLGEPVIANRTYVVTISYRGNMRSDETGLYTRRYQEGNATKWIAAMHLEPVYARRAFPCYDEPAYKAIFNISVTKKANQIALSNMPIRNIEVMKNDVEVVFFDNTPRMSTYLVALFVGDFVPNKNGSHVTVYSQRKFADRRKHIETDAPKFLQTMSEYTGIEYSLPKLDLLYVPCWNCRAMESWGLNFYGENFATSKNPKTLAMSESFVLQHEIAHQWFGNLVTCAWWDCVWLNEGFATYFEYFATKMVKTAWPIEELFVLEIHQTALSVDQRLDRPITSPTNSHEEIKNQFDLITYDKSASLLRLLSYLVTEKLFQLSIRHYLHAMRDCVAEPNDLFASFDKVLYDNNYAIGNGLTVNEFMSNWTLQSGYPVLQITKNVTSNTLSVTQSRFVTHPSTEKNTCSPAWHIGLTFTTELSKDFNYTQPRFWTNKTSKTTVVPVLRNSGWYIFNIKSIGFYRVNYDMDNWMALIKQLHEAPVEIHVLNRAQLIYDAFHLAMAGQLDFTVPIHLAEYLPNENSTIPWYSALRCFSIIKQKVVLSVNLQDRFGQLIESTNKKLKELILNGGDESHVIDESNLILKWMCDVDYRFCSTNPLQYFEKL